jgi:hypothetical protein
MKPENEVNLAPIIEIGRRLVVCAVSGACIVTPAIAAKQPLCAPRSQLCEMVAHLPDDPPHNQLPGLASSVKLTLTANSTATVSLSGRITIGARGGGNLKV